MRGMRAGVEKVDDVPISFFFTQRLQCQEPTSVHRVVAILQRFAKELGKLTIWWSTSPCATISPATRAMCDATARFAT